MTDRMDRPSEFDARLVAWLDRTAPESEPEGLLARVLSTTEVTRRRPAWWRPAGPFGATRPARLASRSLAIAATLILVLLALALALGAGSRPAPVREFGPLVAARQGELLIVDLSGAIERRIATGDLAGTGLWSPDGSRLAYGDGTKDQPVLVVADRSLTVVARIALPVGAVPSFSWSADGRRITFGLDGARTSRIYVVDVATGAVPTPITEVGLAALAPSWSPDGSLIAFAATAANQQGLFVVGPDGTGLRRLTLESPGVATTCRFSWSADSRTIALETDSTVSTVDVDDTNEQTILRSNVDPHCPVLSPDGRRMTVNVRWTGNGRFQVLELDRTIIADTSVQHPFHEIPGLEAGMAPAIWSPDGRVIVATGHDPGTKKPMSQFVDPNGAEPARPLAIDDAIVVDWRRLP
jgi:Tol biopolymer transport system component